MVIVDKSGQLRPTIDVPHALIEKSISFKHPKKDIVMKLIYKSFSFTLIKTNKCLDM